MAEPRKTTHRRKPAHDRKPAQPAAPAHDIRLATVDALAGARGTTPQARLASRAVIALCHAASSFNLYDAANEAVKGFITDLRDSLTDFLDSHGDLDLAVQPWDILYAGEPVYQDRDRERSLPFRLYRDGVRRLVVHPGVSWDEVIRLLGVLAIRARGIRQQEDDVVTLLWNAAFEHVEVRAVEGLLGDDDERVAGHGSGERAPTVGPLTSLQAMAFKAPYTFDHPPPVVGDRGQVAYREVPPHYLVSVLEQDGADAVPLECAQLIDELLTLMTDEEDPLGVDDVAPVLQEVRGYLLGEGKLREYVQILRLVDRRAAPESRERLLPALADEGVVRRILQLADAAGAPGYRELARAIARIPGDHGDTLLAHLAANLIGEGRRVALDLLEDQARREPGRIAERLLANLNAADLELLRLLAGVDRTVAVDVATTLVASANPIIQIESLRILDQAPYGPKVGRAMAVAASSVYEPVRRQAIGMLLARRERRAWDVLAEKLRNPGADEPTTFEASFLGEALAMLDPERSRSTFREWLRPAGLLGRVAVTPPLQRWAAVAGLALLPGQDSRELIEWLAARSAGDLAGHCQAALARLAAAGRGGA